MTSKAWIVYRHTSPSGKVYIGITSDLPKRRWGNGIHKYASNPYFIKAIQKHGWENFTHEILHKGLSHDEACTYEKELITFYKRGGICYNITDGGEGTLGVHKPRHSKEWKQTLSEQMSGKNNYFYDKHFIGELHPMWGKHHSDKTKALQSLRKNKIKKKVLQYTLDLQFIREYESIRAAERETKIPHQHISDCCREDKPTKSAGGYIWKFENYE